jgi:tetratricopeptide (TPR) repeat protein
MDEAARQVQVIEDHIRGQRFAEAERLLLTYIAERPNSSWGWYAIGYAQFGQRKTGEAIRSLAKSLELNVKNAEAHKVLGRCLMFIGRFDAAEVEFEQAARLNPGSAEARYNLGKLFSIQDNWTRARAEFEAALRIEPDYMEAHDGLGFALEALGEDVAATKAYRKAIALNEARSAGFSTPYVNLSACHARMGEPQLALEHARTATTVNPGSDRAWFQLGRAQERTGELDAAVQSVKRAISINARVASYQYVLGTLSRRLGQVEESRLAMKAFTRLNAESSELETRRREALREETRAPAPAAETSRRE